MSVGMAETGTETSCLMLAPWRRCASGTDSRNFHMACAWASEVASMASLSAPAAAASSSSEVKSAVRFWFGFGELSSISKYQPQSQQLYRGRCNDAERAFGADKQGFYVVSGIVLAQTLQRREHPAVGQHHLQPQHQVAHHPVAQYRRTAGIGGEVAADLCGSLRSQAQGK